MGSVPSFREFVDGLVNEVHSEQFTKNAVVSVGATVARTILANLISLPFGRISMAPLIKRTPAKDDIRAQLYAAVFAEFAPKDQDDPEELKVKDAKVSIYSAYLDLLPNVQKGAMINLAINKPAEYRALVEKIIENLVRGITSK